MEKYREAGFATDYAYRKARAEAKRWSSEHSRCAASAYDPRGRHRSPKAFREYYNAFVSSATGTHAKTKNPRGHILALNRYFNHNRDLTDALGKSYSHNPYRNLM